MISEERAKECERLVWHAALRYRGPNVDTGEMVSEAWRGAIRADELFDEDRGCTFATYGYPHMLSKCRLTLRQHNRRRARECVRLDAPWDADTNETVRDSVMYETRDDDELIDRQAARLRLEEMLSGLTPRERTVIVERFVEGKTFGEVGQEIGLTRQRACQIHERALEKLRKMALADPFMREMAGV